MRPKNYSTKVPASETAIDIQRMLAKRGATSITVDYERGKPVGIRFSYPTEFGQVPFAVPIKVDEVWRYLVENGEKEGIRAYYRSKEHAEMLAWRSALDWLQLQLDYIDIGMLTFDQAMTGYMVEKKSGLTFYEVMRAERLALPPAGGTSAI